MLDSLLNAFRAPDIRRRILFVLGILIVYRMLAQVPLPGIDREALAAFFQNNAALFLKNSASAVRSIPGSGTWARSR